MIMTCAIDTQRLADIEERLAAYRARELELLSRSGVKSYTIGPRSLTRYDTSLKDIQDAIRELQAECDELKCGGRRRLAAVPRNW